MKGSIEDILSALRASDLREGANAETIADSLAKLKRELPQEYLEFLRRSNGYEGLIADSQYLVLWPVEVLAEYNAGSCVDEFAPGLLLFGSDGGGEAFAFDTRFEPPTIVKVSFIPLCHTGAVILGTGFLEFLATFAMSDL